VFFLVLAPRERGVLRRQPERHSRLDAEGAPLEQGNTRAAVNLRFRDGSIYQSFPPTWTAMCPSRSLPFFNWLIAEVGLHPLKATGATIR